MGFSFNIPSTAPAGTTQITIEDGSSAIFVGPNGGGKTRFAVWLENKHDLNTHRISAHRALTLNSSVVKTNERIALQGLRTGHAHESANQGQRNSHRWQGKAAVSLLNDFDFLLQALFADQTNKSVETHLRVRRGEHSPAAATKFEELVAIWERLLPRRKLIISGDDIRVTADTTASAYNAAEMSDGERAVFYIIGQTLAAAANSLLIFDEPELHVHRSVMSKLWDELEAIRHDCAFVLITHDLEFAASRVAQKFVIRDYEPEPRWTIDELTQNDVFDEDLTTLILGSRRPVLFVEGGRGSLDIAIYRSCYPEFTVIPRGSCGQVIHSVTTMRENSQFTRIACGGIVDADGFQDVEQLLAMGVAVLPVSEIENVFLLPSVSRAIARCEGYESEELEKKLKDLEEAIFAKVSAEAAIQGVVARYCRRRVDRHLKMIDLSGSVTIEDMESKFVRETAAIRVSALAEEATNRIRSAISSRDLLGLLALCDNKGLLSVAASHLRASRKTDFESWLTRTLRSRTSALASAVRGVLPPIDVR